MFILRFLYVLCVALSSASCNLFRLPSSDTGCQGEFRGRCKCGLVQLNGALQYVTNCTDSGFADAVTVLKQIPVETEILIFTGNDINVLVGDSFGDDLFTLSKLHTLDLSRNNIRKISGDAFGRLPNVRKLWLNDNRWRLRAENETGMQLFKGTMPQLEEVHLDRSFSELPKGDVGVVVQLLKTVVGSRENHLHKIYLRGNSIEGYLNLDTFCDFPSLRELNLAGNNIELLVWKKACLSKLHTLDLSENEIRLLNETMENLDAIGDLTVDMSGNNFVCDCQLVPFYRWMHTTDVHILNRESYVCTTGFPESNVGLSIMSMSVESFKCKNFVRLRSSSFGFINTVVLSAILLLSVIVLTACFRKVFRKINNPAVYRRMQYSVIQKQDEPEIGV